MTGTKQTIAQAFAAASQYHRRAKTQQWVANKLACQLPHLPLPPKPHILELGCGTGFLSQHLLNHHPNGRFLLTDLVAPMVLRCRDNLANQAPQPHFAIMDGQHTALRPGFDLIAASLVFQWFLNPLQSLNHLVDLLHPGGYLLFSTLGDNNFLEWHQATAQWHPPHTQTYPSINTWRHNWPANGVGQIHEENLTVPFPTGLAFLRELKAIGAHRPNPHYRPLNSGQMRRMLRNLENQGEFPVTYHLFFGCFKKNGARPGTCLHKTPRSDSEIPGNSGNSGDSHLIRRGLRKFRGQSLNS